MTRTLASRCGSSLVELLTAMLFISVLTAISYSFARAALLTTRIYDIKIEAQEITTLAIDMMTRELRMAGFSASGNTLAGIRTATHDRVDAATDLNGDGDTTDSNERIAYSYDERKQQLARDTGGGPQPLVPNVPPGGLRLSYYDSEGSPLPAGDLEMTAAMRDRIRRIDIFLRVEFPNPSPRVAEPLTTTQVASVTLRNR
jgi:hypothetical protein